uniref:Uncharacterized protein n=1 Tax=Chenopodium quinoa TaxID=63459 RepID=A0A803LUD2_CHEQI
MTATKKLSKGDSSCDHIEEAANYIKDLEKNVKELQDKREKLKNSLSEMPNDVGSSTSSIISITNPSINENYVKIKTSVDELEIEINTAVEEEDMFPLSKVLKMLQLDEGLNVVNCAYSKVNQRWMYVIRCQYSLGALTQTFSGRVGDLELAAVAVENSVIAGLGYGVMLGMGSALETLCGQAFGAGKLRMLGIYMQRSWIILLITAILLTPLYVYSPSVLQLFGETEEISLAAV